MLNNSFVKINLNHYLDNLKYLQDISHKKLIAVIKANAYGTVDHIMAKFAKEVGVNCFGVSSLIEALNLRKYDKDSEIIILGYVPICDLKLIKKYNLTISTVSLDYVSALIKEDVKDLKIHLKIDTGMHRIGLFKNEVQNVLDLLLTHSAKVEGIFTHYACSDCNQELTQRQYDEFKSIVESLNYPFKYIHTSNTDATVNFNDEISTHVRCGLGILGYSSFESDLKPVVSLYTHINNTKCLPKDQSLSYGHHYTTSKDEYISTLTIGYADGLWRKNTLRHVYVEDEYATIVGNVCMDQLMIRTNQYHPFGTLVEIFGNHISLYDMAKELDTIPYEILTSLSDRVDRVYTYNNEIILKYNPRYNGLMEDLCV